MKYRLGHLEITNICNFKCQFCADGQLTRKRGSMCPDLFNRLVDEIASEQLTDAIALHVFGEPLAHKNASDFIHYVKSKKLKLNITTNASLLHAKYIDLICSLMEDGDSVHISFRSTNESVFKLQRNNAAFDDYLLGIQNLIQKKVASKSAFRLRVDVFWQTIFNYFLLSRREDMNKYILNSESAAKILEWIENIVGEKARDDIANYSIFGNTRLVEFNHNIALYFQPLTEAIDDSYHRRIKAKRGYCDMRYFTVFCDGTVGPCCNNYDARISFGSVNDRNLKDILSDRRTILFRKKMSSGLLPHDFCRLCRGHSTVFGWFSKQLLGYMKIRLDPYKNRKMYCAR